MHAFSYHLSNCPYFIGPHPCLHHPVISLFSTTVCLSRRIFWVPFIFWLFTMKCVVCGFPGSHCQQQQTSAQCNFFDAHLDSNYRETMIVPCFARRQLHSMTRKLFIALDSEGAEYVFCMKEGFYSTHICGSGYESFIKNFELKVGDRVRVQLDTPPPHFRVLALSDSSSSEQIGSSQGVGLSLSVSEASEDVGTIFVYTNGLELIASQILTMNNRLIERGSGMGIVLIHKLTESDIKHNGMRIPKRIVSELKIHKRGWSLLSMGGEINMKDAEYHIQSDGRLRFKSGWDSFCKEFHLPIGAVVVVTFLKNNSTDDYLKISVDVI